MRAAGFQFRFQKTERRRGIRPRLAQAKNRVRHLAIVIHRHTPFTVGQQMFLQRRLDRAFRVAPVAAPQRKVNLLPMPFAKLLVQRHQRRALFGEHQHAGGIAVEPVHQFEKFCVRPCRAQLFNRAEANAAATMHRQPGRLVNNQQRRVLIQNIKLHAHAKFWGIRRRLLSKPDRRHPHPVTALNTISGPNTTLIHPHFTTTQNPVDVARGNPF